MVVTYSLTTRASLRLAGTSRRVKFPDQGNGSSRVGISIVGSSIVGMMMGVEGGRVGGTGVLVDGTFVDVAGGIWVSVERGVRVGRTVGVDRTTPVAVGTERRVFVVVGGTRVRGVNVLRTIGVAVPVWVAMPVRVGPGVPSAVAVEPVAIGNGPTSSSGSERKISAITTQMKTNKNSTINTACRNDRFSRSFLRKLVFTFATLLKKGP
jgi:hypothetical protein